jgi:phospholipid transport system substrate-binding protein
MNSALNSTSHAGIHFSRRSLLGMLAVAALPLGRHAIAEPAPADAAATVRALNAALLASMKTGTRIPFNQRFQTLAPAVDQAFDLRAVLATSVGPGWASLAPDEQNRLLDAFRRYTVATYVANFDSYAGQNFIVSPDTRSLNAGRVLVQTRIVPASGEPTELDYVMQPTGSGWKIVDVLAAGSISRVAVQRSDFRHLLSSGGSNALLVSLQRKATDLSGGAIA